MKKQVIGMIALAVLAGSALAQTDRQTAHFKKFDTDDDGKISSAEHDEMVKSQLAKKGVTDYQGEAAKRFKNKDTDGDGFISLEEHKALADKLKSAKSKNQGAKK